MITVAALSPSLDVTFVVQTLTFGEIHRPTQVVRCAGGKPLNMARAAKTLGGSPSVVALLGGPTGNDLSARLRAADVPVVVVEASAETRICVSISADDTQQLTEVYPPSEGPGPAVWEQFRATVRRQVLQRRGWLSFSGGLPQGMPAVAVAELVEDAMAVGRQVAVDTHGPALRSALDTRPSLVKVNRAEAAELLGTGPDTSLSDMAQEIRRRTGGLAVLTDGAAGSIAVDSTGAFTAQATPVDGRFPVGSGDSFLGGLVHGLDQGSPVPDALRLAMAAGMANAMVPGAGLFTRAAAQEMVSLVRVTAVP